MSKMFSMSASFVTLLCSKFEMSQVFYMKAICKTMMVSVGFDTTTVAN